jgi:hypothetical protein
MIECLVCAAVGSWVAGCVAFEDTGDGEHPVAPDSGSDEQSGSDSPAGLRVFVTHERYTGNLTAYLGSSINGLAAGDAICQVRADSAGLGGKWRAWLSSSEIDAIDRVSGNGPWNLVGFAVAFANRAQLQTEPSDPLDVDEHGEQIREPFGLSEVWTGTRAGGVHSMSTCANWTSTLARGTYGVSQEGTFEWTEYSTEDCDFEKHLVCLEQAL